MSMSASLIRFLRNTFILLITVMLMLTVPTLKDHITARAIRDTLEMESCVWVGLSYLVLGHLLLICELFICSDYPYHFSFIKTSTNVTHLDCHLSINTWLTFVMMMLTVQTQKDLTTADA